MNNTSALVLPNEVPISLDTETKKKLVNWEDFISYYVQLNEASNSFSWIKADVLLALSEKFGTQSLEKVSADIGEPRSTVVNYVRTSKAFAPERRDPSISFSHHFQASFADSYDEHKGEFATEKRYEWVEKAAEQSLSTRTIRDEIQEQKQKQMAGGHVVDKCNLCKNEGGKMEKYVLFVPNTSRAGDKFKFHQECYFKLIKFISDYGTNREEDII